MEKSSSSPNQEPLIISVSPNPQFDSTNEDRPSNGRRSYYPQIDYLSKDQFYPSKRSSSNKCIICGAEEESHKKKKEKQSIVGNMLRERFGLNEESKNSNADVTLDCELTDKEYSQNKLKCNHLCCNE